MHFTVDLYLSVKIISVIALSMFLLGSYVYSKLAEVFQRRQLVFYENVGVDICQQSEAAYHQRMDSVSRNQRFYILTHISIVLTITNIVMITTAAHLRQRNTCHRRQFWCQHNWLVMTQEILNFFLSLAAGAVVVD